MTGPDHYREAERLLDDAAGLAQGDDTGKEALTVSHALAHATLALAAATALANAGTMPTFDGEAWMNAAASVRPKP